MRCAAWQSGDEWAWCSGSWDTVRRAVIVGPQWMVDVVERDRPDAASLNSPGISTASSTSVRGARGGGSRESEFVGDVGGWLPPSDRFLPVTARNRVGRARRRLLPAAGRDLLRAYGPGLPGSGSKQQFVIRRFTAMKGSMVSVIDTGGTVTGIASSGVRSRFAKARRSTTLHVGAIEVTISSAGQTTNYRAPPARCGSAHCSRSARQPPFGRGNVGRIPLPALDGTFNGFRVASARR